MSPFDESAEILSVFIKIPESLTIRELEDRYEKAIQQALVTSGFGEVTDSCGLHPSPNCDNHQIPYCGINVALFEDAGIELLRTELLRLNAPPGTVIELTKDGIVYGT